LLEQNEKVINYYNNEYRYAAGKTVFLGMLVGFASCFVTKAVTSIHVASLGVVFVQAAIAVASSIYGLNKTINAYLTLMDLSSVDKAIYLMENKEVINKHIKEKYQSGFVIEKKNPYKCLSTIFKKTGEIELNVNNLDMVPLKQLREMKRIAEMVSVSQLSQTESTLEYDSGSRVKK
jgi:small-conductance mechanosensitive channel